MSDTCVRAGWSWDRRSLLVPSADQEIVCDRLEHNGMVCGTDFLILTPSYNSIVAGKPIRITSETMFLFTGDVGNETLAKMILS